MIKLLLNKEKWKMANIYDIAKAANVSKSTVSRVLNDKPGVSKSKREKVLEVMKALNYKPNSAARKLGLKRTNTIGVLVNDLSDAFYSEYVRKIDKIFTNKLHYGALYCTTNKHTSTKVNYLEQLNKTVDGYIFLGEEVITKKELKILQSDGEKFVGIGTNLTSDGGMMVDINNFNASYTLVEYLIGLGHKNIMCVTSNSKRIEFSERFMGYQKALMDSELRSQPNIAIGFDKSEAYSISSQVVDLVNENNITAIVCFNDIAAIGLIDGLIDEGYEVPKDVSVVGFDDFKGLMKSNNNIPRLTTMAQPNDAMASYGVNGLYNMIVNNEKGYSKIFDCELVIGESTRKL